jgi:glutaminyl-tRNA synthetase
MVVLNPLEIEIENYPDNHVEYLDAENNPEDESAGKRQVPFSKYIYIEREDYLETPSKNWFRFTVGAEVRLKNAYYLTCKEAIKDDEGNVTKLICTYDPDSKGGWTKDGRKVKGTSHWVSKELAVPVEIRNYEHLFLKADPMEFEEGQDYTVNLNPDSLTVLKNCLAEPSLLNANIGDKYQFLRLGYYCIDYDSTKENIVINRIVSLKDSFVKQK